MSRAALPLAQAWVLESGLRSAPVSALALELRSAQAWAPVWALLTAKWPARGVVGLSW
jgi:hypothetical protein